MSKVIFCAETLKKLKISLYRIAKDTGLSYSTLLPILHGTRNPKFMTARRIADVMNIPLDSLVFMGESVPAAGSSPVVETVANDIL